MGETVVDERSVGDRFAAMHERLEALRSRNEEMLARAAQTTERVRSAEGRPRVRCNHANEADQVREMLEGVEHELEGLRMAMDTRAVIEQAKGMLMLHRQCDADEAFQALVSLSQTSHCKLAEVAQTLVESWTAGHAPT
ncbi:MAG TPA: ANTAR domain-containing protein [Mycobacteriales bacterium]|nr:ANTAR domain-containing protein [Mycobacteriales bacterium]